MNDWVHLAEIFAPKEARKYLEEVGVSLGRYRQGLVKDCDGSFTDCLLTEESLNILESKCRGSFHWELYPIED